MRLHQAQKLCTAKEMITKMRRQHVEREKTLTNHISGTGLIAKIYKELIQLDGKQEIQF